MVKTTYNTPRSQMLGCNYCNPNKDRPPPHLGRCVPFSSKDPEFIKHTPQIKTIY